MYIFKDAGGGLQPTEMTEITATKFLFVQEYSVSMATQLQ